MLKVLVVFSSSLKLIEIFTYFWYFHSIQSADILRAFLSPMSNHCRLSWLVNTNCGIMNHTEESNNHWWAKENIRWPGLWQSPQKINYHRKKLFFSVYDDASVYIEMLLFIKWKMKKGNQHLLEDIVLIWASQYNSIN